MVSRRLNRSRMRTSGKPDSGHRGGHARSVGDDEEDTEDCPAQADRGEEDDERRRAGHQSAGDAQLGVL